MLPSDTDCKRNFRDAFEREVDRLIDEQIEWVWLIFGSLDRYDPTSKFLKGSEDCLWF